MLVVYVAKSARHITRTLASTAHLCDGGHCILARSMLPGGGEANDVLSWSTKKRMDIVRTNM